MTNLTNMTEEQLDQAYEAAVNHKNQIKTEIRHLENQLVFDKNNQAVINLLAEKEEMKAEVQAEIRALLRA